MKEYLILENLDLAKLNEDMIVEFPPTEKRCKLIICTEKWYEKQCREKNKRMKKYISKDDFETFLIWHNITLDKIPFPTITKADICEEFAEKVKDKVAGEWHENIDKVLEEEMML